MRRTGGREEVGEDRWLGEGEQESAIQEDNSGYRQPEMLEI
jgi:hypothetical protein